MTPAIPHDDVTASHILTDHGLFRVPLDHPDESEPLDEAVRRDWDARR